MLTSPNLRALSSSGQQKGPDIHSYLTSQARFSKVHATEGRQARESWDTGEPTQDKANAPIPPIASVWASAFDTPVLKARTIEPKNKLGTRISTVQVTVKESEEKAPISTKTSRKKDTTPQSPPPAKAKPRPAALSPKRIANKKRNSEKELKKRPAHDTDDEQTHHLTERRERKRAKREIMKPTAPQPPSETGVDEGDDKRITLKKSKGKKTKAKAPKMPAGLALMHGFSATNVGKHRLTLDPRIAPGVFGRGKASAKADTRKQSLSKGNHRYGFSEDLFLRGTRQSASRKRRQPSSSDEANDSASTTSSSSSTHSDPPPLSNRLVKQKASARATRTSPTAKLRNGPPSQTSSSTPKRHAGLHTPQHSPTHTASEVWDIEIEDRVLPSGSGISVASANAADHSDTGDDPPSPLNHACTNALDTLVAPFYPRPLSEDPQRPDAAPQSAVSHVEHVQSDSSLGPSESASQVLQHALQQRATLATHSRFFTNPSPLVESKTAPHNIESQRINGQAYLSPTLAQAARNSLIFAPSKDKKGSLSSYSHTHHAHSVRQSSPMAAPLIQRACSSPRSPERDLADLTDLAGYQPCLETSLSSMLRHDSSSTVNVLQDHRRPHSPTSRCSVSPSWPVSYLSEEYMPSNLLAIYQDDPAEHASEVLLDDDFPTYSLRDDIGNPEIYAEYDYPVHEHYSSVVSDDEYHYHPGVVDHDGVEYVDYVSGHDQEYSVSPQENLQLTQSSMISRSDNDGVFLDMPEAYDDHTESEALESERHEGEWGLQGRALLMGLDRESRGGTLARGGTRSAGVWWAEEDVARSLRNHWLPQRS